MSIPFLAANQGNYKVGRDGKRVEWLVLHYTSNSGDTAKGNCQYFNRTVTKTSAHYFVDENEVWQSVKDTDTAWHCGRSDGKYKHPQCRNANSIGVELCNARSSVPEAVFERAADFVRTLAEQYGIDRAHILRHYDVTGKNCPAPWVENEAEFQRFLDRVFDKGDDDDMMTQEQFNEMFNKAMDSYLSELAKKDDAPWGEEWDAAKAWAEDTGLIKGDQYGNKMYQSWPTRQTLALMFYRKYKEG